MSFKKLFALTAFDSGTKEAALVLFQHFRKPSFQVQVSQRFANFDMY